MSIFVLAPEADLQALAVIAQEAGWSLVSDVPRTHTRLRSREYRTPGGAVTWVEHHGLGVRHVKTEDAAALELLRRLPTLSVSDLFAGCEDPDPVKAMAALNALSVAEPEDAFFAALGRHAKHENVWVRRNARYLVQYFSGERALAVVRSALGDVELGELWKEQVERLQGGA